MNAFEAQGVVESLRRGLPPDTHIRQFTIGREFEINQLAARFIHDDTGALLVKANYGVGKTHLLRLILEMGLGEGFAVSLVTLDANSAIRFSRLDEITGAVWRALQTPEKSQLKGLRTFFDLACGQIQSSRGERNPTSFWARLTNNWQWDFSEVLEFPAIFIALRAWACGDPGVQDLIVDWLYEPWRYYAQRRLLYHELITKLRPYFRDPRPEHKFIDTRAGIFDFQSQDYAQSWAVLRDIHVLARACGLKGIVLLIDEFEDVVTNLNRFKEQEAAFWNLFQFFASKQFPALTFFAVTPEFVSDCKALLLNKGFWDYDYSRFESLPTIEINPLDDVELLLLSEHIVKAHANAYSWHAEKAVTSQEMVALVQGAAATRIADRARYTIRQVVSTLDQRLENVGHEEHLGE